MNTNPKKSSASTSVTVVDPVATWLALVIAAEEKKKQCAAHAAAINAVRTPSGRLSDERQIELLVHRVEVLRAEDMATAAQGPATVACHSRELAAHDPLAIACDPRRIEMELDPLIVDTERARVEYIEAERRMLAFISGAIGARDDLAARRQKAGLPPPAPLPRIPQVGWGETPRGWLDAILAAPVGAKPRNAEMITKLTREETGLRAAIEQRRIDREQAVADAAAQRASDRRLEERRARESQAERDAQLAEIRAADQRREGLAAAHRQRASGVAEGTGERVIDGASGALLVE